MFIPCSPQYTAWLKGREIYAGNVKIWLFYLIRCAFIIIYICFQSLCGKGERIIFSWFGTVIQGGEVLCNCIGHRNPVSHWCESILPPKWNWEWVGITLKWWKNIWSFFPCQSSMIQFLNFPYGLTRVFLRKWES